MVSFITYWTSYFTLVDGILVQLIVALDLECVRKTGSTAKANGYNNYQLLLLI